MTTADEPTAATARPMDPWRVRAVYAVVGVIVLGHVYEIVRQQEHWPFTNYPMWARVSRDWHIHEILPFGVTAAPSSGEVDLRDPKYFAPMPALYQKLNFQRAANRPAVRDRMLGDYLKRYEQLRAAGKHDGPPLKAIRLYEWYWTMDRNASNATSPDRKTLLYEYPVPSTQPAGGAQ